MYTYRAAVERVIDGDTYVLEVDLGFNITKRVELRLRGVDTHETYGYSKESEEYQKGIEEKQYVEHWMEDAAESVDADYPLILETHKDSKGKYGRYLGDIYHPELGMSLAESLIEQFGDELAYDS